MFFLWPSIYEDVHHFRSYHHSFHLFHTFDNILFNSTFVLLVMRPLRTFQLLIFSRVLYFQPFRPCHPFHPIRPLRCFCSICLLLRLSRFVEASSSSHLCICSLRVVSFLAFHILSFFRGGLIFCLFWTFSRCTLFSSISLFSHVHIPPFSQILKKNTSICSFDLSPVSHFSLRHNCPTSHLWFADLCHLVLHLILCVFLPPESPFSPFNECSPSSH